MIGLISTLALNWVRNGSPTGGRSELSFMSKTRRQVRLPSKGAKYAASGLRWSRISLISSGILPLRIASFDFSSRRTCVCTFSLCPLYEVRPLLRLERGAQQQRVYEAAVGAWPMAPTQRPGLPAEGGHGDVRDVVRAGG